MEQESPFSEFLNSPVFASESGTASPPFELSYPSLFPSSSYLFAPTPALAPLPDSEMMLQGSPALPALPALSALPALPNSTSSHTTSPTPPTTSTTTTSEKALTIKTSRRGTGFRGPSTPLVAIDAPIRPRNYLVDSTTSKKRKTAAVERELTKRGRTSASPDSGAAKAATEVKPEDAIPEDIAAAVERKRLQNTLSARKSRQRKQERLGELEERNKELETENEGLKQRVQALEAMAKAFGLTF